MGTVYVWFLVALGVIAAVGAVAAGLEISPLAMERVGIIARILGSLTAAGLLGFAFVIDKLVDPDINLVEFFANRGAGDALAMTTMLIIAGAIGLLAALMLAIFDPPSAESSPRFLRTCRWLRRWAGGCMATACVAVVLLFPAAVALILAAGDAQRVG